MKQGSILLFLLNQGRQVCLDLPGGLALEGIIKVLPGCHLHVNLEGKLRLTPTAI